MYSTHCVYLGVVLGIDLARLAGWVMFVTGGGICHTGDHRRAKLRPSKGTIAWNLKRDTGVAPHCAVLAVLRMQNRMGTPRTAGLP